MAECSTCGTHVSSRTYTCPACRNNHQLEHLQAQLGQGLANIAQVQREGFASLAEGLSGLTAALEWGFEQINWRLRQQTEVLTSIDRTLSTPSETQANEWRIMGDRLKERGVPSEAMEFYQKALELNRLDYRTYVSLAESLVQQNLFNEARGILEKSLPHAPKAEIDYKSYSYRLIKHIYACNENYKQAATVLREAMKLSPTYADCYYDFAKCSAQLKATKHCLSTLQRAITLNPSILCLAQHERAFRPVQVGVLQLIAGISSAACLTAKQAIDRARDAVRRAELAVTDAENASLVAGVNKQIESALILQKAIEELAEVDAKVATGAYPSFLEAPTVANDCYERAKGASVKAYSEFRHYHNRLEGQLKNMHFTGSRFMLWSPLLAIFAGMMVWVFVSVMATGKGNDPLGAKSYLIQYVLPLGAALLGLVGSIAIGQRSLRAERRGLALWQELGRNHAAHKE